jgi:hypothetical protein
MVNPVSQFQGVVPHNIIGQEFLFHNQGLILSKNLDVFVKQHGDEINNPADSKNTAGQYPNEPENKSAP